MIRRQESLASVVFFFSLSLICLSDLLFAGTPLQGRSPQDSVVKVYLNFEFSGVMYGNRYIPQVRVNKVVELQGAVVGPKGHVVCYVGSSWPELRLPGIDVAVSIQTSKGFRYPARFVGLDERIALVVLECADLKGRPLYTASNLSKDGLRVLAYSGNDYHFITPRVIKVERNHLLPRRELQVVPLGGSPDIPVEGGIVLDREDQFVGVVTQGRPHPFSKRIQVWDVLPSDIVLSSATHILNKRENIKSGWLGILLDPYSKQLRVERVIANSPAEKAGLRRGDIISKVDGQRVRTRSILTELIRWKGADSTMNFSISRNGGSQTVSTILSERQDSGPMVSWRLELPEFVNANSRLVEQMKLYRTVLPPHIKIGLVLEPVTPQLAKCFRCPENHGLLVKSVLPNSLAQEVGFQAGDVLTKFNGLDVGTQAHIEKHLELLGDSVAVIQFVRNGRLLTQKLILH